MFRKFAVVLSMLALMGTALPAGAEDEIHYCFGEQATIVVNRFWATVEGTSGPDVIWGSHTIDGRGGDDLICSLNGGDKVYGGEGDDKIDGGDNQDTIEGGPGDDYLVGGNNHYAGVPGGETLSYEHASGPVNVDLTWGIAYGEGTDTLIDFMEIVGSDYGDTLRGSSELHENGNYIDGRGGDDILYGTQVNGVYHEVVVGGEGDDRLYGLRGNDFLFGDEGDDSLYGGRRGDQLTGGPGDDHMDGGIEGDCVSYGDLNLGNMMIFPGSAEGIAASLAMGTAEGDGSDTFANVECLRGSEHDDVLSGNGDPNTLFGNGGNDLLKTWRGDDRLFDGLGIDRLLGGRGSDFLAWDDGAAGDTFDGSRGTDECHADPEDILTNWSADSYSSIQVVDSAQRAFGYGIGTRERFARV